MRLDERISFKTIIPGKTFHVHYRVYTYRMGVCAYCAANHHKRFIKMPGHIFDKPLIVHELGFYLGNFYFRDIYKVPGVGVHHEK